MRASHVLVRLLALAAVLTVVTFAWAKGPDTLPTVEGKRTSLKVQVVRYTGGVNGEMIVEVQNTGTKPETFTAQGLYFVPEGDPDKAPQRLGAAGPFVIDGQGDKPLEQVQLAPKAKAQLRLQVFCIDSHRASPSASNGFRTAKDRLPQQLRQEIDSRAKAALKQHGNKMPAAKAAIQSEVWGARNQRWIQLDGERKNERNANDGRVMPQQPSRRQPHRIREPLPQQNQEQIQEQRAR
jgi:hypothetical protein